MRPHCTQLLAELQHDDDDDDSEEEEEGEEGGEEKAGKKGEGGEEEIVEDVPDKSIKHMLTAAAGFYSSSMDVQKRVEKSLSALIPTLPSLLDQCRQNQLVLAAMHAEGGGEEEESSRMARMRARVAGELLSHPHSSFSSLVFADMRDSIEEELDAMRSELERVEAEVRERTLRERGEEADSASYLHALRTIAAEKARVAIPYLLSASDELELDLLELSDAHLCSVLMADQLRGVKGEAVAMVRSVERHRAEIEEGHDPPSCLRSTSALSSFLSGSPPAGLEEDPSFVSAMSALSKSDVCASSRWRCDFDQHWAWLSSTCAEWSELEARIRQALDKKSTAAEFPMLSALLDELRASNVINPEFESALSARLQYIARASVSGQSGGDEEEEGGLEDRIRMALSRESTEEDLHMLKKLLKELRSAGEVDTDLESALAERLRYVLEQFISM
eukprot:CAMPEP_0113879422 /NCGR_PEP_ID=MMETSP0780_2-20120614/7231_1 /TAXON_ID=652834 /ORGANISM="Palpitomonas bilix" /LENGTH=447 /DNA_ID=CAMNT_0000866005 /DNA_START=294 /DNA_END=1637 /DNA_ORIENTATION=- /assembly_acc=CAM_ASM_000599